MAAVDFLRSRSTIGKELRFFVTDTEEPKEEGPYIITRHFRLYRAPIVLVRTTSDFYRALGVAMNTTLPTAMDNAVH